ncbi:hypothetical protein F9C11_12430 [Amycolatopsis sp. VS8301801F10]|uniref:hypothetical protein n=1 Tax=Amycolatopsis sp. VS8301801F10 TaxID=2652442 RepID=UPI0038FC73D2
MTLAVGGLAGQLAAGCRTSWRLAPDGWAAGGWAGWRMRRTAGGWDGWRLAGVVELVGFLAGRLMVGWDC